MSLLRFARSFAAFAVVGALVVSSCKRESGPTADAPESKAAASDGAMPQAAESAGAESLPAIPKMPTDDTGTAPDAAEATAPSDEPAEEADSALSDDERIQRLKDLAAAVAGGGGDDADRVALKAAVFGSMHHDAPAVRGQAIASAAALDPETAKDVLSEAVSDDVPEVAARAIEAARQLDLEWRMQVLRQSLKSPEATIRGMSVEEIAEIRPKYRIQYIFPALDDPDPTVRETTAKSLESLFGRPFENSAQATQWWADNAHGYDMQLAPKDPPATE